MYSASPEGVEVGGKTLANLGADKRSYIESVSSWALKQSFTSLVKAIYDAYPKMRENSIFRD